MPGKRRKERRGKAQGLAKDSKLVEQQQEQPLKEKSAEQCLKFSEASRVVKPHYVASVSLNKINALLDEASAEICPGVFVAPLFKGNWGACAQIQIEPGKSHGPYVNTARYMVGRVAVASAESDEAPLSLEISIADRAPQRLGQDGYFQIPFNTVYSLHNRRWAARVYRVDFERLVHNATQNHCIYA